MLRLKQENEQLLQEINQLSVTVTNIEQEIIAWNAAPFYKEQFAREQLQMAKEGEIIFLTAHTT